MAAINPDPTIFQLFYKAYPTSNILDAEQRDLVHYAAANHNPDILEFLIQKKVEVNNRDAKGYTPLMIACILGRTENVKLLIEESQKLMKGCDDEQEKSVFKFTTYQGGAKNNSPLHWAS